MFTFTRHVTKPERYTKTQNVSPQKEHEQLLVEQKDLVDKRDQNRKMVQEFRQRTEPVIQNHLHITMTETEKVWIFVWSAWGLCSVTRKDVTQLRSSCFLSLRRR